MDPSDKQTERAVRWHERVRTACALITALVTVLRDVASWHPHLR